MAGMTGTAISAKREFKKVYKKQVVAIPCNRPVQRTNFPTKIFANFKDKLDSIVCEVNEIVSKDRAVLIGTRSVSISECVSKSLTEAGIDHAVLNSRNLAQEAEIVEGAGMPRTVTVATNMAGRGTDIKLHPEVRANGGLHVILTEIHDSKRIDWQLIGRASRQGDPGSYRIFLAADDEILTLGLSPNKRRVVKKMVLKGESLRQTLPYFYQAQRNVENKHLVDRLMLLRQNKDRYRMLADTGQDPLLV